MFFKIYDVIKKFMKENWLFVILFVIILICLFVRLPYEVNMPGGIIDLGNRVTIDGEEVEIDGSFNMAYVSVVQGSIPHIILGLVIPDWDVVAESETTYENETVDEANTRNKLSLEQSKDYAIVSALEAAGIDYEITNKLNYVAYIDSNANTTLEVGDNIIKCNGMELADVSEMSSVIAQAEVGETIEFVVLRNNKEVSAKAVVYESDEKHYVGISVITTFDVESEVDVEIESRSSESGPSGGLMMSLMVYNALTKQDLTYGKTIVGTGTISLDGTVGDIGGVKYKLMGAVKNDADVFLVPEGNYEEAMEVKEEKGYNIEIVAVSTLQDAIDYLEGLK